AEYSELYFPDIYWPDFTPQEFAKALGEFESRKRRFGQ
ncbi:MAG TPA: undecaprenyl diphosphate synthase family protein, partial [Patescibacteria group bacterium]